MATELNQGQPLTREIYNSLVREINAVKPLTSEIENNIDVRGRTFNYTKMAVEADVRDNIRLKKSEDSETVSINFTSPFSAVPIITATVYHGNENLHLSCVIHEVTQSGCKVTVWRNDYGTDKEDRKQITCRVGYIAIGLRAPA